MKDAPKYIYWRTKRGLSALHIEHPDAAGQPLCGHAPKLLPNSRLLHFSTPVAPDDETICQRCKRAWRARIRSQAVAVSVG